jgi:hypothetical protein
MRYGIKGLNAIQAPGSILNSAEAFQQGKYLAGALRI